LWSLSNPSTTRNATKTKTSRATCPDMRDEEWLAAHTVAELRDVAEARGVEIPSRCRKSEIIGRLMDGGS